jgi:hypothetical protein
MQAMPRIIRSPKPFFDRRKIRQIKFGGTVLKDVQPEDAAKLVELIRDAHRSVCRRPGSPS